MQLEQNVDLGNQRLLAQSIFDCAMLVLIGMIGAKLMWLLLAPAGYVAVPASLPAEATSQTTTKLASAAIDPAILSSKNPFGIESVIDQDADVSATAPAPETTLDVQLKGIRHSTGQQQGGGFIELSSGETAFVQVGDYIVADVRVDEILPNQIILRRNGKRESLTIRAEEDRVLLPYQGESSSEPRVLFSDGGGASERSRTAGQSAAPQSFKAEINNPAELLASVRFEAFNEGPRTVGYLVTPRGDPAAMQAAGFAAGDIILSVNGRSVAQLDEQDLTDMLSFSQRLRFKVKRAEEDFQIVLSTKGAN